MFNRQFYKFLVFVLLLAVVGCAGIIKSQFDTLYGTPEIVDRRIVEHSEAPEFYRDIKPIFDQRCVVCHACNDAPCQLKLSSFEGLDRGSSADKVYNAKRLIAAEPSRLFLDAQHTDQWRERGFYPVLNERMQTPQANIAASSLAQVLELKVKHPLPEVEILPDSFDLALNPSQQCSTVEDFEKYAAKYPLWGMPYALPGIEPQSTALIKKWLMAGAPAMAYPPMADEVAALIKQWEDFFNGSSLKEQLMSRYIYEHLFLAHLYFPELDSAGGKHSGYFELVRSATPSGTPIDVLATRRPYDHPGTDTFYYRIRPVRSTIVDKTHMPYRLDAARMQRWQALFVEPDYDVTELPSYELHVASNPFKAFRALPIGSRYKFMIDEAQFTIMGFIKGPVCRGQVSLNVINDHFWVIFTDPEIEAKQTFSEFVNGEAEFLRLPAEARSAAASLIHWHKFSKLQHKYFADKAAEIKRLLPPAGEMNLNTIWDGDGHNPNAALTVFRHFDSAAVEKGLVGGQPKTAWVIDYPLLERIHYLLVAGFDVYGNIGHQLNTRIYMDFLRMEGEYNFLLFMPEEFGKQEFLSWYEGSEGRVKEYVAALNQHESGTRNISYLTDNPKLEFFDLLRERWVTKVLRRAPVFGDNPHEYLAPFARLSKLRGAQLQLMPELSLLKLRRTNGDEELWSIATNQDHSNVSHLFGEKKWIRPEGTTLSIAAGAIGSYPNAFYSVDQAELDDFVRRVETLKSENDYRKLMSTYGIRRTNPDFWSFADRLHQLHWQHGHAAAGILDFNRIENR